MDANNAEVQTALAERFAAACNGCANDNKCSLNKGRKIMHTLNFNDVSKSITNDLYITAGSEKTPINLLVSLARNRSERIRRQVAANPRTPVTILAMLAADGSAEVREGITDNPAAPVGLLFILAGDTSPDVRYAMAESSLMPAQILAVLTRDINPYVAERAARTLSLQNILLLPVAA
jgi:hypothetical protein